MSITFVLVQRKNKLEISVLSAGVTKDDSIFKGGRKLFFLGKSDEGLNIYRNFRKIVKRHL